MTRRAAVVLSVSAILALSALAVPTREGTAQGMMGSGGMMGGSMMGGGGMMGGRTEPGQAAPGSTQSGAPNQQGGATPICGFSGGNPTRGAAIYAHTCIACHGEDGHGRVPGAPDFTKKGGVLSKPHSALQAHIKNGFSSPGSPLSMPPGGGNSSLTDQDLKDVHAYLHKAFGCG